MIPIARPIIEDDEIHAVNEVMRSGVIAEGGRVADFENKYRRYIGVDYAIAVNSGTAALQIALQAAGIGKGDEVITSSFSFIATANSILYTGARPVFTDITPEWFTIDPDEIQTSITPRTRALLPVHLYGHPAEMKTIMEIAEDKKLDVIEDVCQAHGATEHGKHAGSFGIGTFSFYPTKNMTTSEGGMITTDDSEIDTVGRMIRSHGSKQRYHHEMLGYNFRMTDISAAIGLVQLKKLDDFNQKRIQNAGYLSAGLKGLAGIEIPQVRSGCTHVFHQYTIRVTDECRYERDQLVTALGENGIGTGIYYPIPIHKQPFYTKLGYTDSLRNTEIVSRQVISLPVHPSVSREELDHIITTMGELTG